MHGFKRRAGGYNSTVRPFFVIAKGSANSLLLRQVRPISCNSYRSDQLLAVAKISAFLLIAKDPTKCLSLLQVDRFFCHCYRPGHFLVNALGKTNFLSLQQVRVISCQMLQKVRSISCHLTGLALSPARWHGKHTYLSCLGNPG